MNKTASFFIRLGCYIGFSSVAVIMIIILNGGLHTEYYQQQFASPIAAVEPSIIKSVSSLNAKPAKSTPSIVTANQAEYLWPHDDDAANLLINRISPPEGYERDYPEQGSFGYWLQRLPLKAADSKVHLFNGKLKPNQVGHFAVIDIDTGKRDLQQSADAIIRLRGEYLFARGEQEKIRFTFTSGHLAQWSRWSLGERPVIKGSNVSWRKTSSTDTTYASFRKYLDTVFAHAGTTSLAKELSPTSAENVKIGDVFIAPGRPGHCVIVVDLARNRRTGETLLLLAQGFTPAQEVHLLKNPKTNGPWFSANFGKQLETSEWTFKADNLKRFQ